MSTERSSAHATQRFVYLDGVRGAAALAVVWLHAAYTFKLAWVPIHAGLAVDLFFCLSGFVIAHSYEDRLRGAMTFGDYARRRLIRLFPLIVAGAALGFLASAPLMDLGEDALFTAAAAGLLPVGILVGQIAFPTNYPLWSLFFEVVASLAYGLFAKRLSNAWLLTILIGSGVALGAAITLAGQVTNLGVIGAPQFLAGFFRVTYPFLLGVLIYRSGLHLKLFAAPSWILIPVVLAMLLAPIRESAVFHLIAVLVALPGAVALGTRVGVNPRAACVWAWLGEISYPLYIVHLPVLLAVSFFTTERGVNPALAAGVGALTAIVTAWAALVLYDRPVRAWLTGLTGQRQPLSLTRG